MNEFLLNLPLPILDHWGYAIIFLSAIMETLPILGTFIPGQTVVVGAGILAKLGMLRLEAVILAAAIGAVVGDLLAYFIGHKYGYEFIVRYGRYFSINQDKYEKTKILVAEHAGKALIFGRFSPFTRAVTAFLAGICRLKFPRFIFYSIVSGIIWSVVSVLFGYFMGQGFIAAAEYFGWIVFAAVIFIVLIILAYRYLDRKKHIFVRNHLVFLILNAISIYVFSKMAEDYLEKESTYRLDLWLAQNISLISEPWLNRLMVFITSVFSPEVLLAVAMLASIYYAVKKHWYRAALVFLSSAGGAALSAAIKILVARPRPDGGLVLETGFSFPSQHAFMSFIFFSLVYLLFREYIKPLGLRYLFADANFILIIAIGFSRVYLKVHYFSDVVAGYALGIFWLTLLILIFRIGFKLAGEYPWLEKLIKK